MRALLTFSLLLASLPSLTAQKVPRFIKTDVSNSGCKVYLPGTADPVDIAYAPDSSVVYTIETIDSTTGAYFHFGSIIVNLNGIDLEEQEEEMLENYMDYLKGAFNINESAGYGLGHTLDTHTSAKGIIDYWKDEDGDEWIVKGWAAESTLFVMFVYGPSVYPNSNIVDVFFKGARFKGD